jgi:hypothetical protein
MDDENYNQDEATERAKLDQQAFDRLPPAVKLATLLKQEKSQATQSAHLARRGARARQGAVLGSVILLLPHAPLFLSSSWALCLSLVTALGATLGYLIVSGELSPLSGVVLFGGGAMVFDIACYALGVLGSLAMIYFFFMWLFIIGGGLLLASWAKKERDRTDTF